MSPPAAALSAFLRGVERRGAVLAELQCGDAAAGDAALAAAMRQFHASATEWPLGEWPRHFWSALLAQPQLRQRTVVALPLDATDALGQLDAGPRAALLLRLAAGLSEADAAAALGVAEASYRRALRDALARHADGRADPQAWQRLRDQVHRRIKTLAPARLVRLSNAREAVLQGAAWPASEPARAPRAGAGRQQTATAATGPRRRAKAGAGHTNRRARWWRGLLWLLLLLCALGLAATFWWPFARPPFAFGGAGLGNGWGRTVQVSALPPAEPPRRGLDAEAVLVAHRDFDLLADPDGMAAANVLDFHAWLVALDAGTAPSPAPRDDADPVAAPVLPDAGLPPLESADAETDHAL